jgi:hypothetical protein
VMMSFVLIYFFFFFFFFQTEDMQALLTSKKRKQKKKPHLTAVLLIEFFQLETYLHRNNRVYLRSEPLHWQKKKSTLGFFALSTQRAEMHTQYVAKTFKNPISW